VSPTAAYWSPTVLREDTRIPARTTDLTSYEFHSPIGEPVVVEARLIVRRAFRPLADQKGWDVPDILITMWP